jgi:hypothetical protein
VDVAYSAASVTTAGVQVNFVGSTSFSGFTAVIYDFGVYVPGKALPTEPLPGFPPAPFFSFAVPSAGLTLAPGPTAAPGQVAPPDNGQVVPPGQVGSGCFFAPLSGECKPGIMKYGEGQDCVGDFFSFVTDGSYLGCQLSNVATAVSNSGTFIANALLDAWIPGSGTGGNIKSLGDGIGGLKLGGGLGFGGSGGGFDPSGNGVGLGGGGPLVYVWTTPLFSLDYTSALTVAMVDLHPFRGIMGAAIMFVGMVSLVIWVPRRFGLLGS